MVVQLVARLSALFVSYAWAMFGSTVFAQAPPDPYADAITKLLVGGPFGVCLTLVIIGVLNPPSTVKGLSERVVRAEEQRDDATEQLIKDVIPVLTLVNTTVVPALNNSAAVKAELVREVRDLREEQSRMREEFSAMRAELRARPGG